MTKKPSPANALAKYVIMRCNSMGMYAWRNNTVGVYDPKTKSYRANVTHRGVADVIGVDCDGQVLVLHDMLNVFPGKKPKFVRNFMDSQPSIQAAVQAYVSAVKAKTFPAAEHTF